MVTHVILYLSFLNFRWYLLLLFHCIYPDLYPKLPLSLFTIISYRFYWHFFIVFFFLFNFQFNSLFLFIIIIVVINFTITRNIIFIAYYRYYLNLLFMLATTFIDLTSAISYTILCFILLFFDCLICQLSSCSVEVQRS